jgi:hypothetical protein
MGTTAQAQLIQNDQGAPFLSMNYTDVKGHPYLFEDWTEGTVKQSNGKTYSAVPLKYNILTDEVFFKDPKTGQLLAFVVPVIEFKINGTNTEGLLFRNGYKAFDNLSAKSYYQVLFDGGTQLIKRVSKRINEEKPLNSASSIKSFEELTSYFLARSGTPMRIRRDKKSILLALGNNSVALENFIKENQLNLKEENDLVRLITYYNTL